MKSFVAVAVMSVAIVVLSACGSSPSYPLPSIYDLAQPLNFCGAQQLRKTLLPTCVDTCVPDEQVFFFCTDKMGKIAYTRQYLMDKRSFGYSLEYKDPRCGGAGVLVWQLAYISPQPTNASVGAMSASTVNNDCSTEPRMAPFIDANRDRLYYVPLVTTPM